VNVTIISTPDDKGRTQDTVVAVAATGQGIFGPFELAIWNQAGAKVQVDLASDTSLTLAAIRYSPRK
jgi:hypothetical protein